MSYSLLLHMEGSGSTFTDVAGHIVTATATQTTDQFYFGANSAYFNGSTSYIYINNTDLSMGTGNWTIDFWFRPTETQVTYGSIFGNNGYPSDWLALRYDGAQASGNRIGLRVTGETQFTSTASFAADTWHHVALVRSGNNLYLFKNGTLDSTHNVTGRTFNFGNGGFYIGRTGWDGANGYHTGYIDEFRMLKDEAAWTNTFTPPTSAYTWTMPVLRDSLVFNKPIRLARMSTLEASSDLSHVGALYFDTTLQKIRKYENATSKWQDLVADNEVTSSKILLANNTALRGYKTDATVLDILKIDTSNVLTFGSAQLRFNGLTYTFPSGQGSANQLLQNNGSGTLSWGSVASTLQGAYQGNSNTITTSSTYKEIEIAGTESLKITATGGLVINSKKIKEDQMAVKETYNGAITLTNNVSSQTLAALSFSHVVYGSCVIDYSLTETVGTRIGRILISTDGTNVTISDDYTETEDVGVTWGAVINGDNIDVKYTTSNLTVNRTMQATIRQYYRISMADAIADASYSKVSLKLTGEGSTILDTSPLHSTLTTSGSPALSTAQVKNGSNSIYIPQAISSVRAPYEVGFLGSADWTIEGWFYFTSWAAGGKAIFSQLGFGTTYLGYAVYFDAGGDLKMVAATGTTAASWGYALWGYTPPKNVWGHLAIVRYGTNVKLYYNGTSVGNGGGSVGAGATIPASAVIGAAVPTTQSFYLGGGENSIANQNMEFYVDDFRITKGLARYTANFTP